MSLTKIYSVFCDSTSLLISREINSGASDDLLDASRAVRLEIRRDCPIAIGDEIDSKRARAKAREAGWVRHREDALGYGKIESFDLCPNCAPKVVTK